MSCPSCTMNNPEMCAAMYEDDYRAAARGGKDCPDTPPCLKGSQVSVIRHRVEREIKPAAPAVAAPATIDWSLHPAAKGAQVGDITSDARGSGARFNAGKAPVELIPVWIISEDIGRNSVDLDFPQREAFWLLREIGAWQRGGTNAGCVLSKFLGDWTTDCARVFDYGRKKYAAWNWAKGMPWSVPMACAVRHLLAILRGEENDPESGLSHRGHVACNLVMLAQFEQTYPEGDDRPLKWLAAKASQ